MWINVTSRRLRDKKSVGTVINDTRSKVQKLQTSVPSPSGGIADQSVNANSIASGAVDNSSIDTGSITADKLASGSFNPAGQNLQRVPAPLTSSEYWSRATAGNIPTHREGYFFGKENGNVFSTENGILFSPESSSSLVVTHKELGDSGAVITTSTAHGYEVGDVVTVSGVGSPFDGTWTITLVEPETNTFNFNLDEYFQERTLVTTDTYITSGPITNISIAANTVTFTATNSFKAGQFVNVTGVNPVQFNISNYLIDSANATSFAVYDETMTGSFVSGTGSAAVARPAVSSDDSIFDIEYKSLEGSDGVVTITTTEDHSFLVEEIVEISGLGSPYDGIYIVSEVPEDLPRVFRYDTNGNVIERVESTGSVKVEAEARLFLTGKHPVPASKKLEISWISSNSVPVYVVYWKKVNNTDIPVVIPVLESEPSIILKQGASIYEWNVPSEAESYSVYVEVPADSAEFYLQDCAVFEIVGDKNIKSARISSILIENHVITITTADPHAFVVGDVVTFENADYATSNLNGATIAVATVPDYITFTLNSSVSVDPTDGALNLPNTSGVVDMTNTLALVTGTSQQQSAELGLSGLTLQDSRGGKPINLTTGSDKNFFGIYDDATGKYEATIDEDGSAVFSRVQADHLFINDTPFDGIDPIMIGSTSLSGDFPYAKYNDTDYTGALLDRLARGIIYSGSWRLTHGQDVPSGTKYFGLAAGTFELETNRTYSVNASSGGMYPRQNATYGANQDTAFELLVSTSPLEIDASNLVSRISYTVPVGERFSWNNLVGNFSTYPSTILSRPFTAVTGITGTSSSSNANITSSNTANLFIGRTITVTSGPPGFSVTNATVTAIISSTAFTINTNPTTTSNFTFTANEYSSESSTATPGFINRASPSTTATVTVPTEFGQYLKTNALVRIYRSGGTSVDISDALITKVSNTSFTFVSTGTSTLTNYLVSVELIDPILYSTSGTVWSHSVTGVVNDGTNYVYTSRNVFQVGQQVNISGFADSTWNLSSANVTAANSTTFTITPTSPASAATVTGAAATATWTTNQYSVNRQHLPSGRTLYWALRLNHSANTNANYDIYLPDEFSNRTNGLISVSDIGQSKQIYNVEQPKPWTAGYATTDSASVTIGTQTPTGTSNITITTSAHTFSSGQAVTISGVTPSGYNGTWTAQTGTTGTTLVVDIGSNPGQITVAGRVSSAQAKFITETKTVNATSTAYYDSYGKGLGTTNPFAYRYSIYQGASGTASGIKKSAVLFPALDISNLAGVKITKLEVYLHNRYSYRSAGITAYIGAHTYTTLPSDSISSSRVSSDCTAITSSFARGQGKWVTLPSSWHSTFLSDTARGIVLGLTNSTTKTWYSDSDQANYGYFDGVDPTTASENFPRLRVTYEYTFTTVSTSSSGGSGSGGGFVISV
jgi:hypothetical protein